MHSESNLVNKREFDKTINEFSKGRKKETMCFITRAKYKVLLGQVKTARKKKPSELNPKQTHLVRMYDVVNVDGLERLVVASSTNKLTYVSKDELYSIISRAHEETSHGTISAMTKSLKMKYKNVAPEAIAAYLKLCSKCRKEESTRGRRGRRKKTEIKDEDESKENKEDKLSEDKSTQEKRGKKPGVTKDGEDVPAVKPKRSRPQNTESASTKPLTAGMRTPQRIDFIEMMSSSEYDYNFIMVLRESTTKFVHLRPLRSRSPVELVEVLVPIFICFGTPSVLESSNKDFLDSTLELLFEKYPAVPNDILVETAADSQFFADVESLMLSWVCENSKERWYHDLRFVQYIANLYYNKEIGMTPFEAMFGRKGKLDVSSLSFPPELLHGLCAAEDPDIPDVEESTTNLEISEMLEVVLDDA